MIIFIYGEDSFRSKRKIKEFKDKFFKEVDKSGNSFDLLNGALLDMKEINEKTAAPSLLSPRRMIVIENIFLNKNKDFLSDVLEYFKKKEEGGADNIIIFCENSIKVKKNTPKGDKNSKNIVKVDASGREKALLKKEKEMFDFLVGQKFVQEFRGFNNFELNSWIKKEVEIRGGKISQRGIGTLVALAGNNLWQIDKEINKLVNYKKGKVAKLTEGGEPTHIDVEDVEDLVKGGFDEDIFALTDAISARNKTQAIKLLEEQYDAGLTDSHLINMIIRQVKILLQIRSALDQGATSRKMATDLRLHPFIIQKGINQARNFTQDSLKKMFSSLIEIDYKMKTGKAEARLLLNLLISKI